MVSRFSSRFAIPVVLFLVVIGALLRLTNLDGKVFWVDEVHSAIRIAGYGKAEVAQTLGDRYAAPRAPKLLPPSELLTYWVPSEAADAPPAAIAVVEALATDNPQHPPAYYLLARAVLAVWPNPITAARWTAAMLSLLALPAIAWLAWELFHSLPVAIVATGVMAVSPVQILYAQEAREYSMLAAIVAASGALLLRALRLEGRRKWRSAVVPWGMYGASVALGLYVHPLFGYSLLGHGVFVLWINGLRWHATISQFLMAAGCGVAAFVPWVVVYLLNFDGMGWLGRSVEWGALVQRWGLVLTVPFLDLQPFYGDRLVDVETGSDAIALGWAGWLLAVLPAIALIGGSFAVLWWRAAGPARAFVVCSALVPWLCLWLPDVVTGGQRSTVPRFLMPMYVAIALAVAFMLASFLAGDRRYVMGTSLRVRRGFVIPWGTLLAIAIAAAGLGSAIASRTAPTWWTKYSSYYEPQVAALVNAANRPLIVAASEKGTRLMTLCSQLLRQADLGEGDLAGDRARILLLEKPHVPDEFPAGFDRVFLYRPYGELVEGLQRQGWRLETRHAKGQLVEVLPGAGQ